MKKIKSSKAAVAWLTGVSALMCVMTVSAQKLNPNSRWADSYSSGGKCYCATTFDHGIGNYRVNTPAGRKTVREICNKLGKGPGKGNNPVYNTVQCGHEPGHDDFTITVNGKKVQDEKVCPGRVDQGPEKCQVKGPKWDLSVFGGGGGGGGGGGSVNPPGGYTKLKFNKGGKCLDVLRASKARHANLQQYRCSGSSNKQFQFLSQGGGWYMIKNKNSGLCLDVSGRSRSDGANIHQDTCKRQTNRLFKIEDKGAGTFWLRAQHSNKCVGVKNASSSDNANVEQKNCSNNTKIKFN